MAAKKAPAKKMAAPAKPKPASAADFRKKEEADKAKAKAKKRTDVYGQSGFGQTTGGLENQTEARVDKVGKATLKAFGIKVKMPNNSLISSRDNPYYLSSSVKGLTPAQRRVLEGIMSAEAKKPRPKKK